MKTISSSSLIRATIGVAIATALVLLSYPFTNIFFGKSLNTPWYFAALFFLSAVTIVLGWLQVLRQAAELHRNAEETQNRFNSLEELDSDFAARIRNHQNGPLKVTMDVNGTPVTIESTDAGKIEDFVMHISRSIQASNLAEAKALHLRVSESTETYRTEGNIE